MYQIKTAINNFQLQMEISCIFYLWHLSKIKCMTRKSDLSCKLVRYDLYKYLRYPYFYNDFFIQDDINFSHSCIRKSKQAKKLTPQMVAYKQIDLFSTQSKFNKFNTIGQYYNKVL